MTNQDPLLREVDEAIAEDRQWEFFRKNGAVLIGGAAAIVLAVGGWQVWNAQKNARAEEAALEYSTALEALAATPDDGRTALVEISEDAPKGYALLADLNRAGSIAASDREGALAIYRRVYDDGGAPKRLRELARLRAASLAFEDGRDAVLSDLGALPDSDSTFAPYAAELAALASLEDGDYQAARDMFLRASTDPETPEAVRLRAEEFAALAAAGLAGVKISTETRVDDLLDALEGGAHAGHDHGAAPEEAPAEEGLLVGEIEAGEDETPDDGATPGGVEEGAETAPPAETTATGEEN